MVKQSYISPTAYLLLADSADVIAVSSIGEDIIELDEHLF